MVRYSDSSEPQFLHYPQYLSFNLVSRNIIPFNFPFTSTAIAGALMLLQHGHSLIVENEIIISIESFIDKSIISSYIAL